MAFLWLKYDFLGFFRVIIQIELIQTLSSLCIKYKNCVVTIQIEYYNTVI